VSVDLAQLIAIDGHIGLVCVCWLPIIFDRSAQQRPQQRRYDASRQQCKSDPQKHRPIPPQLSEVE